MSVPNISPKIYNKVIKNVRNYFYELDYIEAYTQNRLSILAACENPGSIAEFTYLDKTWPLIQTNQMHLEWELLTRCKNEKGLFVTSTTSSRWERDPVQGRHDYIFPMVEFELPGNFEKMLDIEKGLLQHLGYGDSDKFPVIEYEDACSKYNVSEIDHKEEKMLEDDYGPVVFLINFTRTSNPFWNMKRDGNIVKKCDVIMNGVETIGSAERSCNKQEMEHDFKTQSDGDYAKILYDKFGEERVLKEFNEYVNLDLFPRSGGGIGFTRLLKSMEKERLIFQ
jgi:aspartyl/asparaginyl-tRNA synthetase